MLISNEFEIGEIVYLRTDIDQLKRIVTAIEISSDNSILYELSQGTTSSKHYNFEISLEEDVKMKIDA